MTGKALFEGREFSAFLFDMDGTILTSIAATERVWTRWAIKHGLDVESFLPTMHGVRAVETVRKLNIPGVDAEREAQDLADAEMLDTGGIAPIPGALAFLASLPSDRWAIVTSAPRALALVRCGAAGIPLPDVMVTAEDVTEGKPKPDCFLLAAQRLGFAGSDCLVFEDAVAGIAAGEAAGASVVVISATHSHAMETPHLMVPGYEELRTVAGPKGLRLVERVAKVA
ncbi:HAD-IA family hydrolase [Pararhizobium sp.]|uniref:HAD-IA family hydrolase n=1 Tax=Pararhizobium sp. TaxID=1977563 RepID=UPI00271B255C|nr:HAD-IA family hydrolase [Pararhizobium sp.]MDO9417900.1 HAD-IA family hydrolase [Pararhizobium sp.]